MASSQTGGSESWTSLWCCPMSKKMEGPVSQLRSADLGLTNGWYMDSNDHTLPQLQVDAIGLKSQGVFFLDVEHVEPWLLKCQSFAHPLLALVVGSHPSIASHSTEQHPATFLPTQKRILVPVVTLQLGKSPVKITKPRQIGLQLDATACVRLAWYRDSIGLIWDKVMVSPGKALIDL